MDLRTAYQTKRHQHREIVNNIRSETLYHCGIFLAEIKTDLITCFPQIRFRQSRMSTKAEKLKNLIDTVIYDATARCKSLLIDRKRRTNRQLAYLQNYEHEYEQSANRAVQFLLFIKTSSDPLIKATPNFSQRLLLSLTEGFNNEDVNQLLMRIPKIQMSTRKRLLRINELLRLMDPPVLQMHVCVSVLQRVYHISRVTSERVWISGRVGLILTDTTGVPLNFVLSVNYSEGGSHTVNNCGELIYIDITFVICKLALDDTFTTLLELAPPWKPLSLHASHSNGDFMVGMVNTDTGNGKVTRYNSKGEHILTIQHNNTHQLLYRSPIYIAENNNGDIIVCDNENDVVVVTDFSGKHRFSYTGPPLGYPMRPRGICTDALSHILVCDVNTDSVQVIDKDGHFLSFLLTQEDGVENMWGIDYDERTRLLWVGSYKNSTISVFRYIERRYSLTDSDEEELLWNSFWRWNLKKI